MKQIIGIVAGKGGVGKSSITVNLALIFKKKGFKVGILDADIYGPSIPTMIPESKAPSQDPLNPDLILPAESLGIQMISVAHFPAMQGASLVRAPIANAIISQFVHQVLWDDLDYLFIDFPPGTGDIQLTLMQQTSLHGAVLVTKPQEVALIDVRKAAQMLQKLQVPLLGAIENMSYYFDPSTQTKHFLFGKDGGQKLASEYSIPFLGQIPIDSKLSECHDLGKSIFDHEPHSLSCGAYQDVFERLQEILAEGYRGLVIIQHFIENDQKSLTLEWSDGRSEQYACADLQKKCCCAKCRDEISGLPLVDPEAIDPNVRALSVEMLGRYALKIQFSSGCSNGIYPFSFLRQ